MAVEAPNVSEEIHNEEVVHPPEKQETVSQEQLDNPSSQQEDNKDYNFKQLREGKKQLEEEVRQLRAQMDSFADTQSSSPHKDEDSMDIGDDDLVEGRHVKKLMSRVEKMIYQKEVEAIPDRLKTRFNDFDDVVTKENIENLKKTEPEIYRSITSGSDIFAKGVSAYKTLKALGIYKQPQDFSQQKQHVQSNHNKPMSVQAVKGQGALHEANVFAQGLTPDLKKQLQKEMVRSSECSVITEV